MAYLKIAGVPFLQKLFWILGMCLSSLGFMVQAQNEPVPRVNYYEFDSALSAVQQVLNNEGAAVAIIIVKETQATPNVTPDLKGIAPAPSPAPSEPQIGQRGIVITPTPPPAPPPSNPTPPTPSQPPLTPSFNELICLQLGAYTYAEGAYQMSRHALAYGYQPFIYYFRQDGLYRTLLGPYPLDNIIAISQGLWHRGFEVYATQRCLHLHQNAVPIELGQYGGSGQYMLDDSAKYSPDYGPAASDVNTGLYKPGYSGLGTGSGSAAPYSGGK